MNVHLDKFSCLKREVWSCRGLVGELMSRKLGVCDLSTVYFYVNSYWNSTRNFTSK